MQNCPCGSGKKYLACCGVFIEEQKFPATPEELMRSRYTAYSKNNFIYIADTMKSPAADGFDLESARKRGREVKWISLEIIKTGPDETDKGFVEFQAKYIRKNKIYILHELSEFHFENGRWYYVDGKHFD